MRTQAPPVVAVVVAHDPGPWFEEGLAALAAQDYPNLSLLVLDAASSTDLTPRVAAVAPGAFVRRLAGNAGFAAAANHALEAVEGATHLLLCHDDVAPEPDALRQMMEEAYRCNAGLVAPKLVEWDDPARLLSVGLGLDKLGVAVPRVERGELDQSQHDTPRDVFVAPGGFTLVRSDLFSSLGGYDGTLGLLGEDVDLSWRAQVAGARVLVVPRARVRHLEALRNGRRVVPAELSGSARYRADARSSSASLGALTDRHQLRTLAKCYSGWHLVRVLPHLVLTSLSAALLALLTGRRTRAAALVEAWAWNLAHPLRLRADHAAVQSHRVVRDRDLRRLQTRASAGLGALLHGRLDDGRRFAPSAGSGPWAGGGALVVLAVALLLTFGTRGLLGSRLPSVGAMVPLASWHRLLAQYLSGWRSVGIGSGLAPPLAFPMLGVAGAVSGGSMGLLSQLLYLGGLPLGAIGAWRLGAFAGSRRARWVMLVAWLVVPLPYDALSRGQWQTVVAFGAMPFFLRRLLELTGLAPFGGRGAHAAAPSHPAGAGSMARLRAHAPDLRAVVVLGLLLALVSGLVPPERAVLLVAAAALCLGTLATARPRAALRLGLGALGAVVVADLADLPQSVAVVANGGPWPALVGLGGTSPPSLSGAALAHLALGSAVRSPLSWGLLAAGAVCLVVARGERRGWALRLWTLAVGSLAVAWGAGRAGLGVPDDGIFLVPMGAALALCAGLGWAAFEEDLPRYRFGWRQLVSAVAGVGLAAAALPVLAAAGGGRWGLPSTGVDRVLSWMPTGGSQGQFRVLWVAPPALLPLQGWTLSTGMAYATSTDGPPDAAGLWPGAPGPARALAGAVREAVAGRTVELGHLLAPLAVRYVVVPLLSSPGTEVSAPPTPARERAVTGALSRQLDLRQLQSDPSLVVYQNLSWSPGRAMLTPAAAASASGPWPAAPQATDLSGSRAVLRTPPGATSAAGTLRPGQLLVSVPFRSGWELRGPGGNLRPREAFGVVERFALSTAGRYHLAHSPPAGYLASIWAEAVLWLLALAALWRPRSRSSRAAEQSQIAATLPLPRPVGAVAVPAPEPVAEQAR